MKFVIISGIILLSLIAFLAFGCATIRRDSEVAMHLMTDEDFSRSRIVFISVGVVATILNVPLVRLLFRPKRRQSQ